MHIRWQWYIIIIIIVLFVWKISERRRSRKCICWFVVFLYVYFIGNEEKQYFLATHHWQTKHTYKMDGNFVCASIRRKFQERCNEMVGLLMLRQWHSHLWQTGFPQCGLSCGAIAAVVASAIRKMLFIQNWKCKMQILKNTTCIRFRIHHKCHVPVSENVFVTFSANNISRCILRFFDIRLIEIILKECADLRLRERFRSGLLM